MDVQLYGAKSAHRPSLTKELEDTTPDEARKREIERAGFTAVARKMEPTEDPWANIRPFAAPIDHKESQAYRHWFNHQRVGIDAYEGELPDELPQLVIAINEAQCFSRLKVWVAKSGEAMLVGKLAKQVGREPQRFIIAQWHPHGKCTAFDVMQQSYKRFLRLLVASSGTALAAVIALLFLAILQLPDGHRETSQHTSSSGLGVLPIVLILAATAMTLNASKRRRTPASETTASSGTTDNTALPEGTATANPSTGPGSAANDGTASPSRARANSLQKEGEH